MAIYTVNPLEDRRYDELVRRHPRASVFHSIGWLEALRRTYGYEPVVFTTSPPAADLTNAVAFCRVTSWLTAQRLVSLPFADHCDPLVERPDDLEAIYGALQRVVAAGSSRFIEFRLRHSDDFAPLAAPVSRSHCLHTLDLRPSLSDLHQALHRDCIQRKIRRAQREALSIAEGRSDELVGQFYRLLILTRRRHALPPQPVEWFKNLVACMGDRMTVHVASQNGRPVGAIITLKHNDSMVYKYGVSDERFHRSGTMPLLLWSVIRQAKIEGMREVDFGRSRLADTGLIAFKDRLGASRSTVTYLRYGAPIGSVEDSFLAQGARGLLARAPDKMFVVAGRVLYKHIG